MVDDGPTDDGRTTDHGYTISSPMSLKAQVSWKQISTENMNTCTQIPMKIMNIQAWKKKKHNKKFPWKA